VGKEQKRRGKRKRKPIIPSSVKGWGKALVRQVGGGGEDGKGVGYGQRRGRVGGSCGSEGDDGRWGIGKLLEKTWKIR